MTSPCPSRLTALFCGVLLGTAACTPPDAGRPDRTAAPYLQIVALEDARPIGEDELAALIGATRTSHDFLRLAAIRALGRLESPEHVEEIAEHLQDAVPDVRRQAVAALAQAVHRSDGDVALDLLLDHVGSETDAAVRGIYARSMGRLRLQGIDRARALRAILDLSTVGGEDAHPETLVGVVLGLEAMARGQRGSSLGERAEGRLSNLAFFDRVGERFGVQSARVRRNSLSGSAPNFTKGAGNCAAGRAGRFNKTANSSLLARRRSAAYYLAACYHSRPQQRTAESWHLSHAAAGQKQVDYALAITPWRRAGLPGI